MKAMRYFKPEVLANYAKDDFSHFLDSFWFGGSHSQSFNLIISNQFDNLLLHP